MKPFLTGDEVAIMPTDLAPVADVLEVVKPSYVGSVFIQLPDGRKYATIGGNCLNGNAKSYAVPATDEHRAALKGKA